MNQRTHIRQQGFSLIELAIVLFIIALLLAGLVPTLSSQVEQKHNEDTRKQLLEIQQALIGYAVANGRLPCPANPSIATGALGAGLSAGVPGACTSNPGTLPWVELGINETDSWNRRYTYSVASLFTNTSTLTLSTAANLNVLLAAGGNPVASGVPAVIISHGNNGSGAYNSQGIQITVSSDADEAENSNPNTTFVSHDFTSTFDDQVSWLSPNTLFSRMVAAGKLP